MLFNAAMASMALLGSLASAQSVGTASVVNYCDFPVYLANTPSADGVHQTQSETLQPGQSYSQQYTQLANLMGWSLKLAQSPDFPNDATFQYEYTFLNDGTIWFDLSNVNNQLWNLAYDISSSDCSCDEGLKQVAYLFPDDNSAMETNCTQNADVTVGLCTSSGPGCGSSASTPAWTAPQTTLATSVAAAPVAPTSTTTQAPAAPATTEAPPAAPPAATYTPLGYSAVSSHGPFVPGFAAPNVLAADDASAPAAATTSVAAAPAAAAPTGAIVNEDSDGNVAVVWVTDVVTDHVTLTTTLDAGATPVAKRHEHHAHGHIH